MHVETLVSIGAAATAAGAVVVSAWNAKTATDQAKIARQQVIDNTAKERRTERDRKRLEVAALKGACERLIQNLESTMRLMPRLFKDFEDNHKSYEELYAIYHELRLDVLDKHAQAGPVDGLDSLMMKFWGSIDEMRACLPHIDDENGLELYQEYYHDFWKTSERATRHLSAMQELGNSLVAPHS